MSSYIINIRDITRANRAYLEVLSTNKSQLTIMHLKPGEEIGSEIHEDLDQYIVLADGEATSVLSGVRTKMAMEDMAVVYAGTQHNILADRGVAAGVFTIYSLPEHPPDEFRENKK